MADQGTAAPEATGRGIEVAHNLFIREVEISDLQEQDVNARVMGQREFERLVANVKSRGALESLAYCCQPNGKGPIQIVSGHHRLRAATAAGLKTCHVFVDVSPLSRSEITAKQLAHNALAGEDDPQVVKQLLDFIDNPDDLLASGIDTALFTERDDDLKLFAPHVDFEQHTVTFAFLPHQEHELEKLAEKLSEDHHDLVVTANLDQFETFLRLASKYARIKKVLAGQTVVALMIREALTTIEASEQDEQDEQADDTESDEDEGGR